MAIFRLGPSMAIVRVGMAIIRVDMAIVRVGMAIVRVGMAMVRVGMGIGRAGMGISIGVWPDTSLRMVWVQAQVRNAHLQV